MHRVECLKPNSLLICYCSIFEWVTDGIVYSIFKVRYLVNALISLIILLMIESFVLMFIFDIGTKVVRIH